MEDQKVPARATIKVCLGKKCCARGGEDVFRVLKGSFAPEEAIILPVRECFGCCEDGPNIAVNDNIMRGVKPISVAEDVRTALDDPSCKADGLGSRSIDDLDAVLDSLEKL
jgi:NADH:ubiquinone oxidoreductase subunit E